MGKVNERETTGREGRGLAEGSEDADDGGGQRERVTERETEGEREREEEPEREGRRQTRRRERTRARATTATQGWCLVLVCMGW